MTVSNKIFLIIVALVTCMGCDQATKRLAAFALKQAPMHTFLGDTFRLEYAENAGAFLGLGGGLPGLERWALLTLVSSLVLVALLVFVCVRKDLRALDIVGYSMILAGGMSNMIDRVYAGVVVDFLNVGVGPLRTGIFNVADMVILAGLFLAIASHVGKVRVSAAADASR